MQPENEKVTVHQEERKIPVTVLQKLIKNKSFQFVVESDSSLDDCLDSLKDFKAHIEEIKVRLEKEELENPPVDPKQPEA